MFMLLWKEKGNHTRGPVGGPHGTDCLQVPLREHGNHDQRASGFRFEGKWSQERRAPSPAPSSRGRTLCSPAANSLSQGAHSLRLPSHSSSSPQGLLPQESWEFALLWRSECQNKHLKRTAVLPEKSVSLGFHTPRHNSEETSPWHRRFHVTNCTCENPAHCHCRTAVNPRPNISAQMAPLPTQVNGRTPGLRK